jgi:hypothetical protein
MLTVLLVEDHILLGVGMPAWNLVMKIVDREIGQKNSGVGDGKRSQEERLALAA